MLGVIYILPMQPKNTRQDGIGHWFDGEKDKIRGCKNSKCRSMIVITYKNKKSRLHFTDFQTNFRSKGVVTRRKKLLLHSNFHIHNTLWQDPNAQAQPNRASSTLIKQ